MYQLNYHSIANSGLELDDLDNILETAIACNSENNISGCLIYHNGSFVQILEGLEKDVLNVFENISADKRHHSIKVLWEAPVTQRYFSEWSMAFYRPLDKDLQHYVNNLLILTELSDRSTGSLLSFWASVRKIIRGGTLSQYEKAY
ncbi:BLUF domain-containing protein [Winogradskyella thalassocola]|uniref:Sensors of blue-light using FAD n=1 Tax=Winogradskyella thalassocola TaxID=262004 RepID=A0A1G8FVF3_9FLAO|nr:BLUF domain-containing protein [Winogradskyella thalassocola]SDH86111.1 Sensors of blue-light using FAD [Winogradskyella thalassocola]